MTMPARRRGGLDRLTTAVVTAAMTVLAAAGAAGAAPDETPEQAPPSLPAVGETFDLALATEGIELTINDAKRVTTPLKGSVTFTIEESHDPTGQSVLATPSGFKLSGQVEQSGGGITIEQDSVNANSLLKLTQQYPPKYEQIMALNFTVVIDLPQESAAEQSEPLVLTTKNPSRFVGNPTQFPPQGDVYKLQNPIDLVVPDDPDQDIGTIDKFPLKIGSL